MNYGIDRGSQRFVTLMLGPLIVVVVTTLVWFLSFSRATVTPSAVSVARREPEYRPRQQLDTNGFVSLVKRLPRWTPDASLEEIGTIWRGAGYREIKKIDDRLSDPKLADLPRAINLMAKAMFFNYEGDPKRAYEILEQTRSGAAKNDTVAGEALYTIIYFQGVNALRFGETDNCVICRGESSCILPISPAAVHTNPTGSRLAIRHFTEYLERFPDDLEIRWLLNVAHMTLGEHPQKVDPRFLISLEQNHANRLYHNRGNGTFEEVGEKAGVQGDASGFCKGANWIDYDNDDYPDLFVDFMTGDARLYHNNRDGTFRNVTASLGIDGPRFGFSCWAWDYDNDGWLDIFATCYDNSLEDVVKGLLGQPHQRYSNRLFRNVNGEHFEDKTKSSGLDLVFMTMGSNYGDFDNDGFRTPDRETTG
jgi:hypothetical protein